jgi:hypothetical protein
VIDIQHRSFEETLLACEALGGVDLIVTSPPYPDARPGQYGGDASHDFTWPDYQRLGDHVAGALKPGGFCAVNIDGPVRFWRSKQIGSERSLIAFKLAIDWAERVGLRYVEHCVYAKLGMPGNFHPRWRSGFEPVHVFQRPGARGHFDPWAMTDSATPNTFKHAAHSSGRGAIRGGVTGETHYQTGERKTLNTVLRPVDGGYSISPSHLDGDHPAPFTARFADAFVLCYSPPGGLVCDPFMGSGTVALSCARNGRSVIGGDLGARETDGRRWADIASERAQSTNKPAQSSLFEQHTA